MGAASGFPAAARPPGVYPLTSSILILRYILMGRTATRGKAADISGTHLWLVMMKAHRTLQRLATGSIEAAEVGLSDFAVMEMLLHKGPQAVNEIGRRIPLTS